MLNAQAVKVKGMTRTDPLVKLPYELIRMILQEVGFRALWYVILQMCGWVIR